MKRIQKFPPEGDTFSTAFSDSTTYYDLISGSGDSSPEEDDDEDSDRILGLWFEETLDPSDNNITQTVSQTGVDGQDSASKGVGRAGSIVPEKGEPHGVCLHFFFALL